jgi:three-Cys-motif partner protein
LWGWHLPREWGPWTVIKLEALQKYLKAFTTASKRARGTLYLDLFAGAASNEERETGRAILGSAHRALEADPPFSKVVLCELEKGAARSLEDRFTELYPGRDVTVLPGDCNQTLPGYLEALARRDSGWRFAPSFAFLDQFSAEIRWSTIQWLAEFKHPKAKTKMEQWLYFGDSFLPRGLHGADDARNPAYARRVDEMFGTHDWRKILAARDDDELDASAARHELVNLMRWRLEWDLGYRTTLPLVISNRQGVGLYTMIFATDHDAGAKIMHSIFEGAEKELARMVARAKEERHRRRLDADESLSLFSPEGYVSAKVLQPGPRSPNDPPLAPYEYDHLWEC